MAEYIVDTTDGILDARTTGEVMTPAIRASHASACGTGQAAAHASAVAAMGRRRGCATMPNDEEREEIAISLRLNAQVERIREAVLGGDGKRVRPRVPRGRRPRRLRRRDARLDRARRPGGLRRAPGPHGDVPGVQARRPQARAPMVRPVGPPGGQRGLLQPLRRTRATAAHLVERDRLRLLRASSQTVRTEGG